MRYQFLRFPEGKTKALTFSYDDGVRQDIRLAQLFSGYGLKATFNLNSYSLRENGLTPEEVEQYILQPGHEIAVHGAFHRAEGTLRPIEGIREVLDCRLELEQKHGRIIRGMAYPDSGIRRFHNNADLETVKTYLKELDIAYARTLGKDNDLFELPTDWHQWMPSAHHRNPKILEYVDSFLRADPNAGYSAGRHPILCYIWGHSYEFDRDNNWDMMDTICQKLSRAENIWYATNMEIYDYVQAYYSLVYSADGKRIYNPTLLTIWFDIDGTLYKIAPGQTLQL